MLDSDSTVPFYSDLNGNPLQVGNAYYGVSGQNPITSPITVYWDSAGTQPAKQPVTIVSGRTTRNGAPARVWTSGNYSRLVLDSSGRTISYETAQPASVTLASDLSRSSGSSLVGFQQAGAGSGARTEQDKQREIVSATDFLGVDPTGVADSTAGIQNAVNLAATAGIGLFFPAGTYLIKSPITVPKNSRITLASSAQIYNDRSNASATYHAAWAVGNMHPAAFNYASAGTGQFFKCRDITAAAIGDNTFTLAIAAQTSDFAIGQFVWVRSVAETTISGVQIPNFLHLAKVIAIGVGTITVDDPIPDALATGCLSPVDGTIDSFTGLPWSVTENVVITGGTYRTRNLIWTRSGMYHCAASNMVTADGTNSAPLSLNCVIKSKIEHIHADFGGLPMLEVKCGSRDSVFRDIWGTATPWSGASFEPIGVGEQSRDMLLDNIRCYVGANNTTALSMLNIAGQRVTVRNPVLANLAAPAVAGGSCIFVKGGNWGLYPTKDIVIDGPVMQGRNLSRYIRIGDGTSVDTATNVSIRRMTKNGNPATVNDILFDVSSNVSVDGYPTSMNNAVAAAAALPVIQAYERNVSVNELALLTGTPALTSFASGRAKAWSMDPASEQAVYFVCPAPKFCRNVAVTVQWTNMGAGAGDVRWDVTVVAAAADGDMTAGAAASAFTQTAGLQDVLKVSTAQRFILSAEPSHALIRVTRKAADAADTLANNAGLIGLKVNFF